ncbi:hypothetical protein HBH70_030250 [Parastagonospora nodorum]|nr:hypothetical protein HBH51_027860 [Parastagonospora nodorum]KAH4000529.1 hypothetical protein HBI10_100640 [Parastagonospora nodorum]KAH4026651.1 hypothetical protein HBI13_064970 [Parastagonospora nodorum]KAH4191990.1 hypothetical protein HBH42_116560 [Parastagonospora nodorum]KAH4411534.1 hypothetical protein HBH92_114970 [Parastagonospora nodorum]
MGYLPAICRSKSARHMGLERCRDKRIENRICQNAKGKSLYQSRCQNVFTEKERASLHPRAVCST